MRRLTAEIDMLVFLDGIALEIDGDYEVPVSCEEVRVYVRSRHLCMRSEDDDRGQSSPRGGGRGRDVGNAPAARTPGTRTSTRNAS